MGRASIVDDDGLVVRQRATGLRSPAPLIRPRSTTAHLLSNPSGKPLRVRVIVAADKLIKVVVREHFRVKCRRHAPESLQAANLLQQRRCGL